MARKKSNWGAIAGLLVAAAVVWLIWPRKAHAATSSGGGLVGGGGGGVPQERPQYGQQQGGALPFSMASGGGGGSSVSSALKSWINKVLKQGYANAAQIPILQDNSYLSGLGTDPSLSIGGLQPLSLFDVSQLTQDISGMNNPNYPDLVYPSFADMQIPYDQTSLFDVSQLTQDIPQLADLSSYGIDPNFGSDQVTTQDTQFMLDNFGNEQNLYSYEA